MFDSIATLAVAQNMRELYRLVLVDTPLAPYFSDNLTHEDLDEMNIEVRGQGTVRHIPQTPAKSYAAVAY